MYRTVILFDVTSHQALTAPGTTSMSTVQPTQVPSMLTTVVTLVFIAKVQDPVERPAYTCPHATAYSVPVHSTARNPSPALAPAV